MKKSRIIALLTAVAMIMSVVPAFASDYIVDVDGSVYKKNGGNLVSNSGFENGLEGITQNSEYYEVTDEEAYTGDYSLKAIKSTKGDGAIKAYFEVSDPSASYSLSFMYKNTDSVARRPRVTFAFVDENTYAAQAVPTEENAFTEATGAWIAAGTSTNDQDMEYSKDEWVNYSTIITGNGKASDCAYVVLYIYGLTKNVSYVDDIEVYALEVSSEYGAAMDKAIEKWNKLTIPAGPLTGVGTLNLPREVSVDGILVEWQSSSDLIDVETGAYECGENEELVILTARLYAEGLYDEVYYVMEYPYIVKSMFDVYVEWLNQNVFSKLTGGVSADISLPASYTADGYSKAEFTWECSDPDVIDSNGKFTAPDVTKYVTLTATISCNGASKTTSYRVKALGGNLIPEGLIMYYDFEKPIDLKTSTLYDNSQKANTYNATVTGVTIVDGFGKFSGGSAITLPYNYATELTGSYSVSMWVNLDSSIADSVGKYRFFDFGGSSGSSQFLRYVPNTGQLSFMDRGTSGGASNWAVDTTYTGFANTWRLLTLTYAYSSSSTATVYVDGVQLSSQTTSALSRSINAVAGTSSSRGFIGRTQWHDSSEAADNPDFVGLMDDIRIYNRVLSASEIATLYTETRPIVTAPVTINFVDTDGNAITDSVMVDAEVNANYDVPSSYKTLPSTNVGHKRYVYSYVSSKSIDSIYVSESATNECTLVFKFEEQSIGENLIPNPSFEDGLTGWTTTNYSKQMVAGEDNISIVGDSTDGLEALQTRAGVGSGSAGAISTRWSVEPNTTYMFTYDIKHARGSNATTGFIELMDASGNNLGHIAGEMPGEVWSGSGEYVPTASDGSWTSIEYTFTTTADTAMIGIKLAWASETAPITVDNFGLYKIVKEDTETETTGEEVPVTINFVDTYGNAIKESEVVNVSYDLGIYSVDEEYKTIESKTIGSYVYGYNYIADESVDTIGLSILRDNVITLVFENVKADLNGESIMVDGSFEDEDGNFSWGEWQSPRGDGYFKDIHSDYFYMVNADTNDAVLDTGSIEADNYALGTRWNDSTSGLCSMANFVKVEAGKTYLVSYDYKHTTAGTDASYISTSFQNSKNYTAGESGYNTPAKVTRDWQTNSFMIAAPTDGYIYFHFSWVGSGGSTNTGDNSGNGPYWYFDNFKVIEATTVVNTTITYSSGNAYIYAEDGTTGYLVQATYDMEGALTDVVISEELTLSEDVATKVMVTEGAKLMLVKDLVSLEPLTAAVMAE